MHGHLRTLDGLRGIAILAVMLFHAQVPSRAALQGQGTSVDRAFMAVTGWGWAGVDLFFVLSGFLITGILLDARPETGSGGAGRYLGSFYARRTLRIFPLHYLMIFVFLVLVPLVPVAGSGAIAREVGEYAALAPQQWWFWAYLGNFYFALHGFAGHGIPDVLWSLAIEEQFYLAWPLIVLACPRRALAWTAAAIALAALAFRTTLVAIDVDPVATYVLTPGRLDGLALGALVAAWSRGPAGLSWVKVPCIAAVAASLATLLALGAAGAGASEYSSGIQSVGLSAIAVAAASAVAWVVAFPGSAVSRFVSVAPLRVLGKYAYALYLFHVTIQSALRATGFRAEALPRPFGSALPGLFAFGAVSIGLSLGCAWLSWHLFERHFLRLKDRFPLPQRPSRDEPISSASAPAP
jgi:peptidoglycan/LPS O-acetylase OafA/YrhL